MILLKLKKYNILVVSAALFVFMGTVLCGCSTARGSGHRPSASVQDSSSRPPVSSQADEGQSGSVPASASGDGTTVRDRWESYVNGQSGGDPAGASSGDDGSSGAPSKDGTESSAQSGTENSKTADSVQYGVDAIAALADMEADVEGIGNARFCVVFSEDEHDPYDVVWDYGREYGKFVEAVEDAGMWEVLFDAAFYKANYPMLALQYHDNDALLLEHFQTVGVHEGRQGSEAFNVAAYMENCGGALADAFGEHYECYYFYWALNQDTESEVDTRSNGHPLQMCVKLTYLQAKELENVNKYREEAGAAPVTAHPELMAFACYRAWCDYTGTYTGHDWFYANIDYIDSVLERWDAYSIAENTVCGVAFSGGPAVSNYAQAYRDSPKHYEAMVNPNYQWFGCSNAYWGPDGYGNDKYKHCEYDMYLDALDAYEIGTQ